MVQNKNNFKLVDSSKQELIKKLRILARYGTKKAKSLGIKEENIPNIVHKSRGIN